MTTEVKTTYSAPDGSIKVVVWPSARDDMWDGEVYLHGRLIWRSGAICNDYPGHPAQRAAGNLAAQVSSSMQSTVPRAWREPELWKGWAEPYGPAILTFGIEIHGGEVAPKTA